MKKISRTLTETEIEETHGIADSILRKVFHLSRHEISRLKFSGQILLDEQRIYVNDIAHAGGVLTVVFPEDYKMEQFISCAEPKILYEDEDFIAADKPSGIPVHAGHGHLDDSLGTALI
ncbi:MAG: hypothetical protein EOM64_05870, partial [Erysipelotrichia bacterium]|nr:hypothetical protein [Erysipelotrichia bacterium]